MIEWILFFLSIGVAVEVGFISVLLRGVEDD